MSSELPYSCETSWMKRVVTSLLERPDKPFMLKDLSNIIAIPIEL